MPGIYLAHPSTAAYVSTPLCAPPSLHALSLSLSGLQVRLSADRVGSFILATPYQYGTSWRSKKSPGRTVPARRGRSRRVSSRVTDDCATECVHRSSSGSSSGSSGSRPQRPGGRLLSSAPALIDNSRSKRRSIGRTSRWATMHRVGSLRGQYTLVVSYCL